MSALHSLSFFFLSLFVHPSIRSLSLPLVFPVIILVEGFTLHITTICWPPQSWSSPDLFHLYSTALWHHLSCVLCALAAKQHHLEGNKTKKEKRETEPYYIVRMIDIFPGWCFAEIALKRIQSQAKTLYTQLTKAAKQMLLLWKAGNSWHALME